MPYVRPFIKIADDTIQFDNGNIMQFIPGVSLPKLNNKEVTVQEFMDYLFSDKYIQDIEKAQNE